MRKAEYSKPTPCGANRLANGVQCLMNLLSIDGGTPPGILSDTRVHFSLTAEQTPISISCSWWDSNPQALRHLILSQACMPIPPQEHNYKNYIDFATSSYLKE